MLARREEKGMLKQMKIKVIVDRELVPLNSLQQRLCDEFEIYKNLSISQDPRNFITPPVGVQMTVRSVHPSFGRDTEFERPEELINDIFEYNLTKVHVDTRSSWLPHKEQWSCTSNESIVYSGFVAPDGTYYFVVIAFLISQDATAPDEFDAHESYTDEDVDYFLDIAHENRTDILSEGQDDTNNLVEPEPQG